MRFGVLLNYILEAKFEVDFKMILVQHKIIIDLQS